MHVIFIDDERYGDFRLREKMKIARRNQTLDASSTTRRRSHRDVKAVSTILKNALRSVAVFSVRNTSCDSFQKSIGTNEHVGR